MGNSYLTTFADLSFEFFYCNQFLMIKLPPKCRVFKIRKYKFREEFIIFDHLSWRGLYLVFLLMRSLVVLLRRFYGPLNILGSCRARSVSLATLFLGRLSPLSG